MNVEGFFADRELRGVAASTQRDYRGYLLKWRVLLQAAPDDPPAVVLRRWINTKHSQTAAKIFRIVRAYELWKEDQTNVRSWIRKCRGWRFAPGPRYPLLRPDQFALIMSKLRLDDPTDFRDYVIYNLFWYTGARLDAIRLLRIGDIDLPGRTLMVSTKGGVRGPIVLPDQGAKILGEWIKRWKGGEWLFPGRKRGCPVSQSWISHRLPALAHSVGITNRVWVHGLRHAFASQMSDLGVSLEVIQNQLQHTNEQTTKIYARMSLSRMQKEILPASEKRAVNTPAFQ